MDDVEMTRHVQSRQAGGINELNHSVLREIFLYGTISCIIDKLMERHW